MIFKGIIHLLTPATPLFCVNSCLVFVGDLLFTLSKFSLTLSALDCSITKNFNAGLRHSAGTTCPYRGDVSEPAALLVFFSHSSHFCNFSSCSGGYLGRDGFWLQRTCSYALPSDELPGLCPIVKCANTVSLWLDPLHLRFARKDVQCGHASTVSSNVEKALYDRERAWKSSFLEL